MKVAVTGLALALAIMIVSLCVMTGFSSAIRQKVSGFEPQITIGINPAYVQTDSGALISGSDITPALRVLPQSARLSMAIKQPAILKTADNFSGVIVKGTDSNYDWSFLRDNLIDGVIPDYESDSTLYHVIISRALASVMDLKINDRFDAYFLGDGAYRTRRLKIAGLYDTHFSDYDINYIFSSISLLRNVAGLPDSCATIAEINSIPLHDADHLDELTADINNTYIERQLSGESSQHFTVLNVNQTGMVFFAWLDLLDTNVEVILVIMSLLAALTLVSSLFILILRHVSTIGLLKALGASDRLIRSTFIILTGRIMLRGLIIGNLLGLAIVLIQKFTGIIPLDPEAYYLDHVPVEVSVMPILLLNIAVVILSLIVLLMPSAIIATISPAKAIRYE